MYQRADLRNKALDNAFPSSRFDLLGFQVANHEDRRTPAGSKTFRSSNGKLEEGVVVPVKPTSNEAHPRSVPKFLQRGLLFHPRSPELTSESARNLLLDAGWLRRHTQVRIILAGFCDPLGSEECTHDLADQRGATVKQFLVEAGVDPSQIIGVKGWEKAEPICAASTPHCQEMNRRARIFIAGFPAHRQ